MKHDFEIVPDVGADMGTGAEIADDVMGTGAELPSPIKRRGRPKGSKNKPKTGTGADPKKRKPGRPRKAGAGAETGTGAGTETGTDIGTDAESGTETGTGTERKRGRPKGRKDTYKRTRCKGLSEATSIALHKVKGTLPATDTEGKTYNALIIQHAMKAYEISKRANKEDIGSLYACFGEYMQLCANDGIRMGNQGACTALGLSNMTLHYWRTGQQRKSQPEYKEFAEMVYSILSMGRETMIMDGKINPVIGIFWQRNYDGLRNDTETQNSSEAVDTSGDRLTATEYLEKYGDLLEK